MAFEPSANIGMLMGCVIVDDGVDRLSNGNLGQARSLLWRHWVVLRAVADARDAQPFGPRPSVGFAAGRAPI